MTAPTKALRFAVIGDPIAHSLSPKMHTAAFEAMGLPHTYEALHVRDGQLPAALRALRDGTFAGLNVTLPHKTRVLDLVDEVSPHARSVGAANTLVRDASGRIVAHDTDVAAIAGELASLGMPAGARPSSCALVLGSGGAARAAVGALVSLDVPRIVVRARSAATFEVRPGLPRWQGWSPDEATERDATVVVQATSLGMHGGGPGKDAVDAVAWAALAPSAIVLDVVYAPPATPFVEAARARGLATAGGLGMLARQGALALELWLGRPAPLQAMLAALGPA